MQAATQCADQLEQLLTRTVGYRHDSPWTVTIRQCVPQLAELLAESGDEPIERLAPAVREVLERCELDTAADASERSDYYQLQEATDLLLREMDKVRRVERGRGQWSDCPVPPQMFG